MRIRNWKRFQHFNKRRPPWIRFYRDLLDNKDWHALDGDAAKLLAMLWLLASEDKTLQGRLPIDVDLIAFRFRLKKEHVIKHLPSLMSWLECPVITMISERYQLAPSETETETETETDETGPSASMTKHKYEDHVYLTEDEVKKLVDEMGEESAWEYVRRLDAYIGSTGKKYKSHYKTIIAWRLKDQHK